MPRTLFLTLVALPAPVLAQTATLAGGSGPDIPWLRIILSLLFCLVLAAGAVLALRHYHAQGSGGSGGLLARLRAGPAGLTKPRLAILEARRIGPAGQLCLVTFGGRELLLGVTQGAITVLAERDLPPDDPADGGSA